MSTARPVRLTVFVLTGVSCPPTDPEGGEQEAAGALHPPAEGDRRREPQPPQ